LTPTTHDAWVASERDRLLEEWRDACQLPSVAGETSGLNAMAGWVNQRAARVFDQVEVVETGDAPPVVIGKIEGRSTYRLLVYSHYDVVSPGDPDTWTFDPFAATVSSGAVYARGAGDDKSDVVSRLQALECWLATEGPPPCTIIWLCEGAEEIGSPGLQEVISTRREELAADGCLWESYFHSIDGRPAIGYGSCGVLDLELKLQRLAADQHSGLSGVYRSAVSDLLQATASLTDESGRIVVDGFYDALQRLSDDDLKALADSPPPSLPSAIGPKSIVQHDGNTDLIRRWLMEPSLDVGGITPGNGTLVEHIARDARAVVRFRLMPRQEPEEVAALVARHLDRHGFEDVVVRVTSAIPPSRCALDSALARAVTEATGLIDPLSRPIHHPLVPGSGPLHLIADGLGVPAVMPPGTIRPDSHMHGPDEHILIDDYLDVVRLNVGILERLREAQPAG